MILAIIVPRLPGNVNSSILVVETLRNRMDICRFVIHWHVLDSQIIEGMMFMLH